MGLLFTKKWPGSTEDKSRDTAAADAKLNAEDVLLHPGHR